MVSIVSMENYYDPGCWPQNTDHSPYPFPTQTLPRDYVSEFTSFQSWPLLPIEERAASASKSHSEAEKRRRDRINTQLANLRKFIPKSDKMDKAALLGSVIDHVKDLKRKAMDISRTLTVPTETDQVSVERCTDNKLKKDSVIIKASVCCDDRPELFSELIQVLKGFKLTAVKADIASVGGRIKSILVLCSKDTSEENVCLNTLKQSLKSVVTKIASTSSMVPNCPTRSKRQRFTPNIKSSKKKLKCGLSWCKVEEKISQIGGQNSYKRRDIDLRKGYNCQGGR